MGSKPREESFVTEVMAWLPPLILKKKKNATFQKFKTCIPFVFSSFYIEYQIYLTNLDAAQFFSSFELKHLIAWMSLNWGPSWE